MSGEIKKVCVREKRERERIKREKREMRKRKEKKRINSKGTQKGKNNHNYFVEFSFL